LNPFEFIQAPTGAHPAVSSAGAPTESAGRAVRSKKDETTEVDELKQRIEELESLVAGIGARRTERKRKGKSRASR